MQKQLKILLLSLVVATATQCAPKLRAADPKPATTQIPEKPETNQIRNRVIYLVSLLGSAKEESVNAQSELLNLARRSSEDRKVLIDELIRRTENELQNRQVNNKKVNDKSCSMKAPCNLQCRFLFEVKNGQLKAAHHPRETKLSTETSSIPLFSAYGWKSVIRVAQL